MLKPEHDSIRRLPIFSAAQRITHGLLALGISFELITAWLILHSDLSYPLLVDWHVMIGQVLILPVVFRLYLFFTNGSTHWRLFLPTREQRHVFVDTLRFYASLGRLPCPDWYAYNPVWQILYLIMIALITLTTLSGYLLQSGWTIDGFSNISGHGAIAQWLLYLILAHILFSILHDVKGNGAQISAMLNGNKYFHIKPVKQQPDAPSVSIKDLLNK